MRLESRFPEPIAAKVPEITAMFWVIKVLTTGMGEATSDWFANTSVVLAGAVGLAGFAAGMWFQLRTRAYNAWAYWFAVMMVAVFGTMAADGLHKIVGLPYVVSSTFYAAAVIVIFTVWHRLEGTLSIHSIVTRRRELFYWLTVLATFALGTAVGDLTAIAFDWGYFASGVFFGVAILVPLVAWRLGLNAVVAFWVAYVLTRPLGASFADWLGKPHSKAGGIGWGDGLVALVSTVVIVALVAWVARSRHGVQGAVDASPRRVPEPSA